MLRSSPSPMPCTHGYNAYVPPEYHWMLGHLAEFAIILKMNRPSATVLGLDVPDPDAQMSYLDLFTKQANGG